MASKKIVKIKITLPPGGKLGTVQLDTQVYKEMTPIKARWQLEEIFTLAGWKFDKMEVVS